MNPAHVVGSVENIALAALASLQTCRTTYAVCRQALEEGIPGDFVECGVYAGAQAAIMAKAIMDWCDSAPGGNFFQLHYTLGQSRRVHLFDSFEGIPQPGPADREYLDAGHQAGHASCTLEGVKSNMKQWGIPEELLVYHVGWFESTLQTLQQSAYGHSISKIAVLRLDADLYESTELALQTLYPLLSPGGFLIVDDYGLSGCRDAVKTYMLQKAGGFPPIYFRKP